MDIKVVSRKTESVESYFIINFSKKEGNNFSFST